MESLIMQGSSTLSTASLTAEYDTRDDPVMPSEGVRFNVSAEGSTDALVSDYAFLKLVAQSNLAWEFVPGHILRATLFGGAILGDAPYFERFYVGDFDDLLPSRNLGLGFATRPPAARRS